MLHYAKTPLARQPMTTTELFRMVIATYGYAPIGSQTEGVFEYREQAEKIKDHAVGVVIKNTTGLGWPRYWRIVKANIEEHSEGRGAVVAGCEAVEEQ